METNKLLQLPATLCVETQPPHQSESGNNSPEGSLAVSQAAFRLLFDRHPHSMWIYDVKTLRFLSVNDAAIRNYLYSREDFAKMTIDQLDGSRNPSSREESLESAFAPASEPQVRSHRRKDGTILNVEVASRDLQFEGRPARLVLAADVTGRARAQETTRETEERYRDLFDHANDVIFTTDLQGNLTSLNKAGEIVTGYTAEEVVRRDATQILGAKSLQLARNMREKKVLDGGETTYEIEIARKDGRLISLVVRTSLIYKDGKPNGVRGIARDITERKQMEEELRQTQKMEALGRLASGVAHDFNNLLGVIIGYGELLSGAVGSESPLHTYAEETMKAGQRAASLTGQLLAFGRRQVLEPSVLDLNVVIANVERLLGRVIREDVEMTFHPSSQPGRVKADPVQIEQVLLNLAVNARDAMPNGGHLKIETSIVNVVEIDRTQGTPVPPGRYVLLTVGDTGMGMDERTKANIFEPFFTTKSRGRGTGLGLATVYGIVKQSGGTISVKSEPGKGTTFMIYLPCVDEPLTELTSGAASPQMLTGTETVLLVDDSEAFRSLVRTFLERHGYTVLEARTSPEASQIAASHRGPVHLLLSDVIMPQVNGYQLSDYLRFHRPEMGVLFMSGYGGSGATGREGFKRGVQVLPKPFCKDALLTAVRETLDKQRWQNAALALGAFQDLVETECPN